LNVQATHFGRDDVALNGLAKFFLHAAEEENEHARKLIKYQNLRGGRVLLKAVDAPAHDQWDTALAAVEHALHLEKQVNQVSGPFIAQAVSKGTGIIRFNCFTSRCWICINWPPPIRTRTCPPTWRTSF
jgi:ferritin